MTGPTCCAPVALPVGSAAAARTLPPCKTPRRLTFEPLAMFPCLLPLFVMAMFLPWPVAGGNVPGGIGQINASSESRSHPGSSPGQRFPGTRLTVLLAVHIVDDDAVPVGRHGDPVLTLERPPSVLVAALPMLAHGRAG